MLYAILIIFGICATLFGAYAWSRVLKIEDVAEREQVKKKYQGIAMVLGVVAIVIAGILVFTMF